MRVKTILDELVDISGQVSKKPINIDSRQVRLILDHTALLEGLVILKDGSMKSISIPIPPDLMKLLI